MPDGKKISQLPIVISPMLTDIFPVVQGGVTGQETLGQVLTLFEANITVTNANFSGLLALNHGGTGSDLSGTGGTNQVLKQNTLGGNITVGTLAASNLSNGVTGSGEIVLQTAPTINQPNLVGVTTNTAAASGSIGEYVTANLSAITPVSVTNTTVNIISIPLTAGNWVVGGNILATAANNYTNVVQNVTGAISTTSATLPADNSNTTGFFFNTMTANTFSGFNVPMVNILLTTTTTVYLVANNTFDTNQMNCSGNIWALRIH